MKGKTQPLPTGIWLCTRLIPLIFLLGLPYLGSSSYKCESQDVWNCIYLLELWKWAILCLLSWKVRLQSSGYRSVRDMLFYVSRYSGRHWARWRNSVSRVSQSMTVTGLESHRLSRTEYHHHYCYSYGFLGPFYMTSTLWTLSHFTLLTTPWDS